MAGADSTAPSGAQTETVKNGRAGANTASLRPSLPGTRGVSPIIGVILLVGGTIALAMVVGPFVLSQTSNVGDNQPDPDLQFAYSEDVALGAQDSYGITGQAAGADGLLTITLEDRDTLDAKWINITGTATGGPLTDTTYTDGDTVEVGESVTVWVNRSAEIEVIWNDASADESAILDSFTIFPQAARPPGVPEPDYDCAGWTYPDDFDDVSGIDADNNDLQIDGVVLDCDLSRYAPDIPDVEIDTGGGLIGNADTDGNFIVRSDGNVWGNFVETRNGNNVELYDGSEINADVEASQNVDMQGGSVISGDVKVKNDGEDGNIVSTNSRIEGDVMFNSNGGSIDADSSKFGGDIVLGGTDSSIENLDDTYVSGQIDASGATNYGKIVVQNGSEIAGSGITTHGKVKVTDSTVNGDIETDTGNGVTIQTGSTVNGNVNNTSGGVQHGGSGSSVITGHVNANSLTCNDATSVINGEPCPDYRDPHYDVTIDSVTTPILASNNFTVTATIENGGYDAGSAQTIELLVNGVQNDTVSVDPAGQASTTVTVTSAINESGVYNLTVASDDDWEETTGEAASSLPPEFTSLSLTLTNANSLDVKKTEFDYSIQYGGGSTTVDFEVLDGGVTDSATRSSTGELWEWNHNNTPKPFTYRIDIDGGECYELSISGTASETDTYDVLSEGSTC